MSEPIKMSLARGKEKTDTRKNLFGQEIEVPSVIFTSLIERYIAPPFSTLDAKQGYWKSRRAYWDQMGFQSHLGRAENMLKFSRKSLRLGSSDSKQIVGVFDPVLCEVMYRWFCPPGGLILDPFAGGSVRGIVAAKLGHEYVGVDLRKEQVRENYKQAKACGVGPKWFVGDSRRFASIVGDLKGDFIFSSPPYFYREHYSDLPDDLNNAACYAEFLAGYRKCIADAVGKLRDDRFACFEVAETRHPDGTMADFIGDTVRAFHDAGLSLYNRMVHLKPLSSAFFRAARTFDASRKTTPVHEEVLVFVKGDWKKAVEAIKS